MIKLIEYVKMLLEAKMTLGMANKIFADLGYPNASSMPKDELRNAWAELSIKHHPDKGGDVEVMKDINAAYDLLKKASVVHSFTNDTVRRAWHGPYPPSSFMPPEWETDKNSAFSSENPPEGNIQYYKKKAWEISGKPASIKDNIYGFSNWDGHFFRGGFSVYTTNNPDHWFEISEMLIEWDDYFRSVAVFVSSAKEPGVLYLINHRGKKIIPPKKYEYETSNEDVWYGKPTKKELEKEFEKTL